MSKALPDIDDGYGYQIKHIVMAAPIRVVSKTLNKEPVLLGPNVRDCTAPPVKEKKERVYKPCEKLLIKLKKEHLKNHTSGSTPLLIS